MSLGSTFKTLSDPQRREILMLIKKNYRMSAGEIAEAMHVSPQKLSYHLKLLKESDLLIESKEKSFVYYELNASLFDELILWLKQFYGHVREASFLSSIRGSCHMLRPSSSGWSMTIPTKCYIF